MTDVRLPLIRRLLLGLLLFLPLTAHAQKDLRVFVYGNSLIHHLTDSDETTVPHWLHHLARAGGHGVALDGTWGFLRDFAANLPPEPAWSFRDVPRAWDSDRVAFRRVGFDTILINPANFIQGSPPDAPFAWDNPGGQSPLDATLRVFDWTAPQARGARFFVYEGWADLGPFAGSFPPSARQMRRYHAFNTGDYHLWYLDYVAALQAARPDLDIALIPVASTLSQVLTDTALAELSPADLYTDTAPHGTPTLYFLAALVTYSSLFAEPPPPAPDLLDSLHPILRENYPAVAGAIWAAVSGTQAAAAPFLAPETGLDDPALAMGLNGISDWSSQLPFIDLMKSARPWTGHEPGQWGAWDGARLQAGGWLDDNGWPRALPDGVEAVEAFILTDLPAGAVSAAGRYRVTWVGRGQLDVGGIARDVTRDSNVIRFDFRPGEGLVSLRISATDPADPIRDIVVLREDHVPLWELGEVFNPDWIARIRDLRALRFMDWMATNGSTQVTWDDRPRVADYTWVRRGVPVEIMVRLANEVGADPWFTLPHMADDAHVTAFATHMRDNLDPDLRVYAEWSNEVWNFIFPQAVWARDQAALRWADAAGEDAWMQFAGMRAAEVADIWATVYGADAGERLIRVIAVHTGWPGLEEALLDAPLARAEGRAAPAASFDAYAVSGYFGYELGEPEAADALRGWIASGEAPARAADVIRQGSLRELTRELWPHHARTAAGRGLRLVMYEGGSHVLGHGDLVNDAALTAFYTSFNYTPEMAALYAELLAAWQETSGTLFNAFVDVAAPSRWGSWGAWRHLDDINPRAATLMAWNAGAGAGWEDRAHGTFRHGVLRRGTAVDDTLAGTPQGDILLGLAGDDVIDAGPGDRVHGGPGNDLVRLPGAWGDYARSHDGAALILTGPDGAVRLLAVEAAQFAAEPGLTRALGE